MYFSVNYLAERLRTLCEDLPAAKRTTLNYVLWLLTKVVRKALHNKMDAKNCAMVFAPNLFADNRITGVVELTKIGESMAIRAAVIRVMLEKYNIIFPCGPPC